MLFILLSITHISIITRFSQFFNTLYINSNLGFHDTEFIVNKQKLILNKYLIFDFMLFFCCCLHFFFISCYLYK